MHPASWLPSPATAKGQKLAYEKFVLAYTPFWIGAFAIIIAFQLYEAFDEVILYAHDGYHRL